MLVPLTCASRSFANKDKARDERRGEESKGDNIASGMVAASASLGRARRARENSGAERSCFARGTKLKRARSGRSSGAILGARSHRVTHARPPRFVVTVKAHAKR